MYEYGFLARMVAAKAAANLNKDGGGSAVRVYATSAALYADRGIRSISPEDEYKQRLHETHLDCYAAVEFELFSHTWEGLEA